MPQSFARGGVVAGRWTRFKPDERSLIMRCPTDSRTLSSQHVIRIQLRGSSGGAGRQQIATLIIRQNKVKLTVGQENSLRVMILGEGYSDSPGAVFWLCADSKNCIRFGVGEVRVEHTKLELQHAEGVFHQLREYKLTGAPAGDSFPFYVGGNVELYPFSLRNQATSIPAEDDGTECILRGDSRLPAEVLSLLTNIESRQWNFDDFDLGSAIDTSLQYGKLREILDIKLGKMKALLGTEVEKKHVYLRVPIQQQNPQLAPGDSYVIEIWPPGSESSIHHHDYACAAVEVLHGGIAVELFKTFGLDTEPYDTKELGKGDVTWLAPGINQVHRLKNPHAEPCVTIQSYGYTTNPPEYIPAPEGKFSCVYPFSPEIKCEPEPDIMYLDLLAVLRQEQKPVTITHTSSGWWPFRYNELSAKLDDTEVAFVAGGPLSSNNVTLERLCGKLRSLHPPRKINKACLERMKEVLVLNWDWGRGKWDK